MKNILAAPFLFFRLLLQSALLACNQIWANKMRSVLTTIGIVIGVASVTAVIAAMTGLKTKVLNEFESFGTNKIYMFAHNPPSGPHHDDYDEIRFRKSQFDGILEKCPSVGLFTLYESSGTSVMYGDKVITSARVNAITSSWHKIEGRFVEMGRTFSHVDEEQGRMVCLITKTVRDKLMLDKDCIGDKIVIEERSYTIIGIVEKGADSAMFGGGGVQEEVFIPFETYYRLWRPWWFIAIASSKNPEVSEDAQAELRFFLRNSRGLKPGEPDTFRLEVIMKYVEQFKELSAVLTAVAGGIVGISLLVGGVGIMNIMLVSVSERTREIGLRKAVGARPSAILLQFLVEAVVLCMVGGMIGLLGGYLLMKAVISVSPDGAMNMAYIPAWAIGLAFGFSALVGVLFGMVPAIKASRLDPIDALRHE